MNQQTTTLAAGDIHEYVHAAWCLAVSILWPDRQFSDESTVKALSDLQSYFTMAPDLAEAFKSFLARVIVAKLNTDKCPILHPGFWLNPVNINGLTHSAKKSNAQQKLEKKDPVFDSSVGILAKHYVNYIKNPSVNIVLRCKEDLENLGGNKWMGVFYDGIQRQPSI